MGVLWCVHNRSLGPAAAAAALPSMLPSPHSGAPAHRGACITVPPLARHHPDLHPSVSGRRFGWGRADGRPKLWLRLRTAGDRDSLAGLRL